MIRDDGRPPIGGLRKPIYVMEMGWNRWSDAARLRWLFELRRQLDRTRKSVNAEILRLGGKP